MYYKNLIISTLLIFFFLSGCSLLDKKYEDAFLEKKEFSDAIHLESIHIGMTREQVDYIFGRPVISDSFNDVYHYVFYKEDIQKKKTLSLFFKSNKVYFFEIT